MNVKWSQEGNRKRDSDTVIVEKKYISTSCWSSSIVYFQRNRRTNSRPRCKFYEYFFFRVSSPAVCSFKTENEKKNYFLILFNYEQSTN